MGLGIANSETGVGFENNIRDKEWRTKDTRRYHKASNLVRLEAAILTTTDGEKRPGYALGEEVAATDDAYSKECQGKRDLLEAHVERLSR